MAGPLSKRQQARNEKTLQDLVHNVPGNNQCADCQARNPGWASWSLGIFLCMRCASIHRKLGTHISKVKSLSMDGWSNEQVENMKKAGNITSNKLYNPDNKRPPMPVDADEADSAVERYIRSKYMNQGFAAARRNHTGSTTSDETPPPLPPKNTGKFSFRSASSTFPLFSRSKKDAAARSAHSSPLPPQSPEAAHRPKVSKVFGASLGYDGDDDMHKKLAKLRELGFTDERKNEVVLKGVNGNLERTIESLVRLEGRSPLASPVNEFPSAIRPPASAGGRITGLTTGLTVSRAETARPMSASNNPFDISPVQPISSQSTGNMANRNPYYSNNPFGLTAAQSNDALNQAFNNMSLGAPQPLFPHHTGGLPQQQQQQLISQQSMQPPVPAMPQNYSAVFDNYAYPQQGQQPGLQPAQPVQPMYTGYNPFLTNSQPSQPQQQQQQQAQPLSSLNTNLLPTPTGGAYANNPFARSPTRMATPTSLGQIPEQSQQNFYSSPAQPQQHQQQYQQQQYQQQQQQQPQLLQQQQQPQQQPQMNNPFFPQSAMAAPMPQAQFNQFNQFGQPAAQQAPQRADKASILALYNLPQLAPQTQNTNLEQQQQQQQQPEHQPGPVPMNQVSQHQNQVMNQADAAASVTMSGNKNPFLVGGGAPQPAAAAQPSGMDNMVGNRSRDSMMALGMEWSNGRHSPDAFANLSARSMR
ncbi:Protein gts1 [Diaporthe australafricana]|uniref:Protein gts1 n=1 Tax=Diaporthe australafricana TaxID=127596 RepID=A0ABR3XGU8_9PEZI